MPKSQEGLARLVEREGVANPRIVEAFRTIRREDFVPGMSQRTAYSDRPVSIPESQTTSQPSLIARMIDAVDPKPDDTALEVGTGYGFQTALLASLVAEVVSMDRHAALVEAARRNLERAGIDNVELIVGDGWKGHPEKGPYNVIIVSAAAQGMPRALVDQLSEGGRLVIPLVSAVSDDVYSFVKREGELHRVRLVTPARFVPLVREEAD